MKRKVLIMDTHKEFRHMLKQYIERQDSEITVIEARTRQSGFKKSLQEKPETIFMDIDFLKSNHFNIVDEIKKSVPHCGIIILSMFDEEVLNKLHENKNIDLYLSKNEIGDNLLQVLKT